MWGEMWLAGLPMDPLTEEQASLEGKNLKPHKPWKSLKYLPTWVRVKRAERRGETPQRKIYLLSGVSKAMNRSTTLVAFSLTLASVACCCATLRPSYEIVIKNSSDTKLQDAHVYWTGFESVGGVLVPGGVRSQLHSNPSSSPSHGAMADARWRDPPGGGAGSKGPRAALPRHASLRHSTGRTRRGPSRAEGRTVSGAPPAALPRHVAFMD